MKISTKLYFIAPLYLLATMVFAQVQPTKVVDTPSGTVISNIGGTDIPYSASILEIRSNNKGVLLPRMSTTNRDAIASPQAGLLMYNTSTNQFNYHNGSSWQAASFGNQWGVNGNVLHHSGQVGIGTSSMINMNTFLTVKGNLGGTDYEGMYVDASSANGKPFYGYGNSGNPRAFHYFDGNTGKWNLNIGGTDKITVNNAGYLGVGTVNPTNSLHVIGSSYLDGNAYINGGTEVNGYLYVNNNFDVDVDSYLNRDVIVGRNLNVAGTSTLTGNVTTGGNVSVGANATINGNATVDGALTVNNGKGILQNSHGSAQLKYYTREAAFTAILPGHGLSSEGSVGITPGIFSSAPAVMVGDIVSTGGTVGELFRVQLIVYGCTTTSCKVRLLNTSPNPVNYNVTYNIICIGN